ncbi:DUF3626 domain-containing protein [Pseudobacteriovorax antillogorgiicola]|uniref:DUF3626 domain-containing protein n=1 Tax=Pseudobacteriovorax antillogorgiicola TaxID=1513793 RepID=A0A1Y6BAC1_9BACT|nr:DUF3626 domain-containing protein [Pseudobacteriovorax antillogorgiicola]TCS57548.1 uncharacterized protein DUF3626 [Pseudobacteriovorax antillogorgiicola]SME99839.1 Protein of unknown function [Pseudobacteriovorax antillogorgiicola]
MKQLETCQKQALEAVRYYAEEKKADSIDILQHISNMANISFTNIERFITQLQTRACIALHFHPDRLDKRSLAVIEGLLNDGSYQSQFETGISNGGVTAHSGGARYSFENKLFNGAYEGSLPSSRPKYGALDLKFFPDGPAPRFGSCYLLLKPHMNQYASFTFLDSFLIPKGRASGNQWHCLVSELLTEIFTREHCVGKSNIRVHEALSMIDKQLMSSYDDSYFMQANSSNLDHYIEAQVHCDIDIKTDVLAIVCDRSFQYSESAPLLDLFSQQFNIDLFWHKGFQLPIDQIPDNFRGNAMPTLARKITKGSLSARDFGWISREHRLSKDEVIRDFGAYDPLQSIKYLWHILVRFGSGFQEPSKD